MAVGHWFHWKIYTRKQASFGICKHHHHHPLYHQNYPMLSIHCRSGNILCVLFVENLWEHWKVYIIVHILQMGERSVRYHFMKGRQTLNTFFKKRLIMALPNSFLFSRNFFRRRQWHPTPVRLPGKSHGRRSLVGYIHGVPKSWTRLSDFTFTFHFHALEKEMQPTPVFLPGESQRQGSLVGCRLWGRTESDTTEAT